MRPEIVPMNESHIEELAKLERLCFSSPWSERALRDELKNPLARFLTALIGKRVAGYIGSHEISGECYIANLAVFPEFRGLGIGSALIWAACETAGQAACNFISLEVRKGNHGAVRLYKKHGFCIEGIRNNFYSEPVEDALIMTRRFSSDKSARKENDE